METQNDRIDWISKAKGLAILGVVAVHTVQRFNIAFVSSIAFAGYKNLKTLFQHGEILQMIINQFGVI